MHNEFKDLLHSAEGRSHRVIVIFLDVRSFSSFAGIAESTDTAEFLKSIYIRILDDYFSDALFFKPTGDGLLILLEYDRTSLKPRIRSAVNRRIKLIEAFPRFCEDDPMINFEVPKRLGIGLARGPAPSHSAAGKVLDYSGRPLNLASRLMNLARPSGIVFDETFGMEQLEDEVKARFNKESVYVNGLAENSPMSVFCLNGYTEISDHSKNPLGGFTPFMESPTEQKFKDFAERGRFRHKLTQVPARKDAIQIHLQYPTIRANGSKHPTFVKIKTVVAGYEELAGIAYALFDYSPVAKELKAYGVKDGWPVRTTIEYSVAGDH